MSPFPEGSSMGNTWPTNAGPPPPPLILPPGLPPAAAPAPAIRAPGSGSGPRRDSAEETGRRSGKARCGAGCAGEVVDEVAAEDEEERKGKVEEAREWKGLDEEEERGMVDRGGRPGGVRPRPVGVKEWCGCGCGCGWSVPLDLGLESGEHLGRTLYPIPFADLVSPKPSAVCSTSRERTG